MKLLPLGFVFLIGCQRETGVTAGRERGPCKPDRTCDPGLQCLSELCVRPPPADCGAIAELLASFELGNYAPREQRAPVVAAKREACETAVVSKEEGACIEKAADKFAAAQCVPRLFPELAAKSGGGGDCAGVVAKIRASMQPQMQNLGSDGARMVDKMMPAMRESCEQDGWPETMKRCILASPSGDMNAMQRCSNDMPKAVQDKLAQRMMKLAQ